MEECIFKTSLANILIQEKNRQIIRIEFTKRKTEGLLIEELEDLNVFDPNRYNK